jgi:hypothetical protein
MRGMFEYEWTGITHLIPLILSSNESLGMHPISPWYRIRADIAGESYPVIAR